MWELLYRLSGDDLKSWRYHHIGSIIANVVGFAMFSLIFILSGFSLSVLAVFVIAMTAFNIFAYWNDEGERKKFIDKEDRILKELGRKD